MATTDSRQPVKRVKIESGVYRLGAYVAFREDSPSVGDRYDRWGNVTAYEVPQGSVTWGVIDGAYYDRMQGDVGLPDCQSEFPTLAAATEWVERHG
jgi:hypothetical protein